VISKSTVEEVQSVNDGEDQKVDKATKNKLAENIKPNHVRWCVPGTMLCVPRILITKLFSLLTIKLQTKQFNNLKI
jgi:hypothetical protein